jgi:polysaccharide deacetylase 2 family uncharacterized protein YibQ
MVARSNLVAPDDPRRTRGSQRSSGLVAAWVVLAALAAAIVAWLFANADDTRQRWSMMQPRAVVPLPTDVPSTWTKGDAPVPTAAPTPAPQAEAPPAPAPMPAPAPAPVAAPRGLLPAAPEPALVESSPNGPLPKIGPDGIQPWQAYARPFEAAETKPRVAVLLTGLGLSAAATEAAIKLPADVTLSFSPYAEKLGEQLAAARFAGHETLLDLPLEPVNYPQHDPGPYTLLTTLSATDNVARLEWVLSRGVGYVGVVGQFGTKFSTSSKYLLPMLEALKKRGVMYVDAKASPDSAAGRTARDMGVPRAINDAVIDADGGRAGIDKRLSEIERTVRTERNAVAFASPYPITLDRLTAWMATLPQKGIALAPVSALANRQKDQ